QEYEALMRSAPEERLAASSASSDLWRELPPRHWMFRRHMTDQLRVRRRSTFAMSRDTYRVEDDETDRQDRACDGRLTRDRRDRPAKNGPGRGAGAAGPRGGPGKAGPRPPGGPPPAQSAAPAAPRETRGPGGGCTSQGQARV